MQANISIATQPWVVLIGVCLSCSMMACRSIETSRVEFQFEVPFKEGNPFEREIWGTVDRPSGASIRLPAFWVEANRYAVRVYGREKGVYFLRKVEESENGRTITHPTTTNGPDKQRIRPVQGPSFVRLDEHRPTGFKLDNGQRFVPIGGNIPWLLDPGNRLSERLLPFYKERFEQFSDAGLNWMRIWMVHWSRLNLDWLEEDLAQQPEPGWLEADVAENWDHILEMAESAGVYVQLVLQYHGQYSTETNTKWAFNPWNAANPGGFLEKPADFFKSERAKQLTRQKYRYIVARWGYSPAVMAWELFNEVHWVDALRFEFNEAGVAEWHNEMADYLRSIDAHDHLVTTSIENIDSPINASMDYLQPHIYAIDMLANTRYIDPAYSEINKPVFFGEFGHDHMPLSHEQKQTGVTVIPPIWSGLMGALHIPAQPWFMDLLIETGQLHQFKSLVNFVEETEIALRDNLEPFSPAVQSADRMPLELNPGFVWMRRPELTVYVSTDGSEPTSSALMPGVLIADTLGQKFGFAQQVTFRTNFPRDDSVFVHVKLRERGAGGTTAQLLLNDTVVDEHGWVGPHAPDSFSTQPPINPEPTRAATLGTVVPAGPQEVAVRNFGGPAWFHVDRVETGFDVPSIAAVGKRNNDFIAGWVWNRTGVFFSEEGESSAGYADA